MSTLKRILVTGATGKQGGALITALTSSKAPFHLVALTRNTQSARAQALLQKPNVSLLQGDLDDVSAIFRNSPQPYHGVFSVQTPLNPTKEEKQGISLVSAALANGVKHFVYTSVERGGPSKSDTDPTHIAHFKSKFNIEAHLKKSCADNTDMKYTIIRPVCFMDNLTPNFFGKAFATMWALNEPNSKLQLVSARDIGILAAEIFKSPEQYYGRAISFATDEVTFPEAQKMFKRVTGQEMPMTYYFVARMIKWLAREQMGVMFDWFKTDGFGAEPGEFVKRFPEMRGFEGWLREESGFKGLAK